MLKLWYLVVPFGAKHPRRRLAKPLRPCPNKVMNPFGSPCLRPRIRVIHSGGDLGIVTLHHNLIGQRHKT